MISLAFLAALTGALTQSLDRITIEEALNLAMHNAFSLRIAESKIEKARQQERQARGVFGPSVTLNGNYTKFEGSTTGSTGSSGGGTGGSSGGGTFSGDQKTASVTVSQILDLAGVNRKANKATALTRMAAEAGFGVEANRLKLDVRRAYYDVLLAEALVKVQDDALTSAKERYDKAVIREREGAIPHFDVLRFENELRKTEQARVQAQGNLLTAKQSLNSALARPIETPLEVVPDSTLPQVPDQPSDLVVVGIRSRPEVKQSEYTIQSLGYVAEAQKSSNSPSLIVQATHSRFIDPSPGQGEKTTTGAIVLSFPVFDSGITSAKVAAARQDQEQAKIGFEQLLLGIALEVRSALTQAQTAKKALDVSIDSEKLATEALRLAQIRYDEGAGLLIDVTQAQADLTAAKGNVQNAKYQYLNAYAALLKAIGRDDLNTSESK